MSESVFGGPAVLRCTDMWPTEIPQPLRTALIHSIREHGVLLGAVSVKRAVRVRLCVGWMRAAGARQRMEGWRVLRGGLSAS